MKRSVRTAHDKPGRPSTAIAYGACRAGRCNQDGFSPSKPAMATFRRDHTPGCTWFFTLVTHGRRPWLGDAVAVGAFRQAVSTIRASHPFEILAAVVLPDHLHMIWRLPEVDAAYGLRWGLIKRETARRLCVPSAHRQLRPSQCSRRESGLWQRRFWEHRVRDEDDLQRHVDYIHFNPVKHGLVRNAADWPHSSIHRCIRAGWISEDWGTDPAPGRGGFGE
ncbi:MAG: REP-associated tyrosine transposase [Arenimonas sp.]